MVNYYLTLPLTYKILSSTPLTRTFYRKLSNILGDRLKSKQGLNQFRVDQGRKIVDLLKQYSDIKDGGTALEIGTGWIHWYANFVRVFYDLKIDLFDVWDNRQFNTMKQYLSELPNFLSPEERAVCNLSLIEKASSAESVEKFYELLNYTYTINPKGTLTDYPSEKYNMVFSVYVLANIQRSLLYNGYIKDLYRVLKPGGYSIHIVDSGDQYRHMDTKNTHIKEYLKISDTTWKRYFENSLHYFNRMQISEYLDLFERAGFELVYKEQVYADITDVKLSPDFQKFSPDDLKTHNMIIMHRKPA
ncbi:MAG: class I SAM-dependent methyltransferase [Chlorobiales bacterium]|nr:class I SAM-dependent methyltransferase [Chlorobiales bacterium]